MVRDIVPLILETFSHEIKWPETVEWQRWTGHWRKFPTGVAIIDATIIVGLRHNIVAVLSVCRFPGHLNDIKYFHLMPSIGPGRDMNLPTGLSRDGRLRLSPHPVLVRPNKRNQVRNARRINEELRKCRVNVEHAIVFFKTYRSISGRWRHRRAFLSIVIYCCACLTNRRRFSM